MNHFHAVAWLAWLGAAAAVVLGIDNPVATVVAIVSLGLVAMSFRSRGPEGGSYAFFVKVGLAFLVVRLVLFALTGHTGDTTVFTLPRVALPRWAGGFSLGGRVTAEILAQQAAEGIKITAFLACFGVLLSVVETYRLLRLLPRFLFEAGLVVCIAVTFVPSLLRGAGEIRDAQRLRGHRFRGLRGLKPLVVPVLAGALERSLTLAASMESRGFGRGDPSGRNELAGRLLMLGGLLGVTAGGGFLVSGRHAAGLASAAAGGLCAIAGVRRLPPSSARTRMRPERLDAWDGMLIVCSLAIAATSLAARSLAASDWYAYPAVAWPQIDARLVVLAVALIVPVAVNAARRGWLRLAEAHHPPDAVAAEHP